VQDGKSKLFRPSFKSETDFTIPVGYVSRLLAGAKSAPAERYGCVYSSI